jgi:transcriptional regulator with XRE-family HTH domain
MSRKKIKNYSKKMANNKKPIPDSALRFKYVREHLKVNQMDFARSLGFQNSYFSAIESGVRNISQHVLVNLAKVYNISPTWVLLGQGAMFLNEINTAPDLDPWVKKLTWYCENSPFVKHSILSYFLRILRNDKQIIEDDLKINQSSPGDSQPVNSNMKKEE